MLNLAMDKDDLDPDIIAVENGAFQVLLEKGVPVAKSLGCFLNSR
jgi:hypothetical protein